jgi:acyl-CoA dehydrogenase
LLERALAVTVVAEPIERKLRSAMRSGRFTPALAPGEGAAETIAQAVAAGIIAQTDADILATQRDLVARVVRVDDFGQDLGASLLMPIGQDAAPQKARATSAPEVRRAVA